MIVQQRIERFRSYLLEEGYQLLPTEGDYLLVKYEGVPMALHLDEHDEGFASVVLPFFYPLKDVAQKAHAVRAAHETVRTCKVAKVFVGPDGESVWASAEAFIGSDETYMPMLDRTLAAVKNAARYFVEQMGK